MKKKFKMNKVVKAKWLEALRSGNYRQTQGGLLDREVNKRNKYCCLGVLCAIHAKETGNKFEEEHYLGDSGGLPDEVMAWSGIDSQGTLNKSIHDDGKHDTLAELNDHAEYTFKQIADVIEKQF